ncbi:MAG: hypothetical protein N2C12_18675 [Planctomycetales bacterium]
MSISGVIVGTLTTFVFMFDLILRFPFGRPSVILDIGFIVSGLIIAYLGWSTKKELS